MMIMTMMMRQVCWHWSETLLTLTCLRSRLLRSITDVVLDHVSLVLGFQSFPGLIKQQQPSCFFEMLLLSTLMSASLKSLSLMFLESLKHVGWSGMRLATSCRDSLMWVVNSWDKINDELEQAEQGQLSTEEFNWVHPEQITRDWRQSERGVWWENIL